MKKRILSFVFVLSAVFALAAPMTALAAPAGAAAATAAGWFDVSPVSELGPYEGEFSGYVSGDQGSRAPIVLDLTHRGDDVSGVVTVGEGLYVDGGVCGSAYVPTGEQPASGKTDPADPRQFATQLVFEVSNFEVFVDLTSEITEDGEVITTEAKIDLPWVCGRDPVLNANLERQ